MFWQPKSLLWAWACLFPTLASSFALDEIKGSWAGESTSAYYRPKEPIPDYYTITRTVILIQDSGLFTGEFANGCVFRGQIMRSSSKQFPIQGFMGNCEELRLNGRFDGMFNASGKLRIIIRDKTLGRGDFYGQLKFGAM